MIHLSSGKRETTSRVRAPENTRTTQIPQKCLLYVLRTFRQREAAQIEAGRWNDPLFKCAPYIQLNPHRGATPLDLPRHAARRAKAGPNLWDMHHVGLSKKRNTFFKQGTTYRISAFRAIAGCLASNTYSHVTHLTHASPTFPENRRPFFRS